MRTIETTVYTFEELSEQAKQKAIENLYDINIDFYWWKFTYEDAKNIGLKITGFDIDRGGYCHGEFIESAQNVAENILREHGVNCDTYKTAQTFLADMDAICKKYGNEDEISEDETDEIDQLENEFLYSILEDYRIILQNEYEYLTSEQAIIETIEANGYEFTEKGKLA